MIHQVNILKDKLTTKLMKKSIFAIVFGVSLISIIPFSSPAWSQIRGEDSEEFFNEGDQEMEQEIQGLENESSETTEEQKLEHPLLRYGESNPQVLEEKEEMLEEEELPSSSEN
jgi:hypothetical protein